MNNLYDYLFHYNHHTGLWAAFTREQYRDYFTTVGMSHKEGSSILFAADIKTLTGYIDDKNQQTSGNISVG